MFTFKKLEPENFSKWLIDLILSSVDDLSINRLSQFYTKHNAFVNFSIISNKLGNTL